MSTPVRAAPTPAGDGHHTHHCRRAVSASGRRRLQPLSPGPVIAQRRRQLAKSEPFTATARLVRFRGRRSGGEGEQREDGGDTPLPAGVVPLLFPARERGSALIPPPGGTRTSLSVTLTSPPRGRHRRAQTFRVAQRDAPSHKLGSSPPPRSIQRYPPDRRLCPRAGLLCVAPRACCYRHSAGWWLCCLPVATGRPILAEPSCAG